MATTERLSGAEASRAVKAPCYVASTANLTLSSSQTIDGIAVTAGFRILVKDQTTTTENGIYLSDSSTWTRAKDFDTSRDVMPGTLCYVDRGTAYGASYWVVNSSSTSTSISIGSTAISFSQVNTSLSGVSAFMQTVLDDTSAANARTTLGSGAAGDALFTSTTTAAAISILGVSTGYISSTNITALADLIVGSSANAPIRLANASSNAFLGSTGSSLQWFGPATQAQAEAATSLINPIAPGNVKWLPGYPKTFAIFGVDSTLLISQNVSSVTDLGTADWTVNLSTPYSSTNHVFALGVVIPTSGTGPTPILAARPSSAALRITMRDATGAISETGTTQISFISLGDFV